MNHSNWHCPDCGNEHRTPQDAGTLCAACEVRAECQWEANAILRDDLEAAEAVADSRLGVIRELADMALAAGVDEDEVVEVLRRAMQ